MLKLDRMLISGFKSFSDRTDVQFPDGITAVVGPNGCGKSNIGDAINWVLGEQSPKMLRGKHMADVIFNGSRARKPMGMAEVSIHLRGAEGIDRAEGGRLVVTRRLFRSGDSDYLLNGAKARLKDIQEILRQARIGTKTYATIEQGKIDQVLNAKPKDRRLIIEDAAGIAGYKHKRRLTELKLEATQANLLRVNDIVVEVRRQINSLKRQAAKARRYQRLREEMREREQLRFALKARAMDAQLARWREQEQQARDAESETAATLGKREVEVIDERAALDQANAQFREVAERLHTLEIEIDREERQVADCRERVAESEAGATRYDAEAETLAARRLETEDYVKQRRGVLDHETRSCAAICAALSERQAELEQAEQTLNRQRHEIDQLRRKQFESMRAAAELRNQLRSTEEARERAGQQRARLEAERAVAGEDWTRLQTQSSALEQDFEQHATREAQLKEELAGAESALVALRNHHAREVQDLAGARATEKSTQARLATLEDVATRFAGVSDGVKMLLTSARSSGVTPRGVVADFVQAGAEVEGAAENYLARILPAVIMDDDGDVFRAAEWLRAEGAGRTSMISRTQPAGSLAVGSPQNGHDMLPDAMRADRRVRGRLRDQVVLNTAANGVVGERIGDAILVDSLETALELHRMHPTADYLTPTGDVVYASGLIDVAGASSGDRGLLAHSRQVHETQAALAAATGSVAELGARADRTRDELVRLDVEAREKRQALDEAARQRMELELHSKRSVEERERTGRRTQVLDAELETLTLEAARLSDGLKDLVARTAEAEQAHNALEHQLEASLAQLATTEGLLRAVGEAVAVRRAELAAGEQRRESLEQETRRLDEALTELVDRVEAARKQADEARKRGVGAAALRESTEKTLLQHLEERERFAADGSTMERRIAERRTQLAELEASLGTARGELETLRERTRELELERARTEAARQHLDDLCAQELGMTATAAAAAAGEAIEGAQLESLEDALTKLRAEVEQIGPVNMTAIEEYSELEERYAFLTAQREDLDSAMHSLRETIKRINRQSRDRFTEAFEAIRASYQEIFKLLFNGGRADLRLEEGEDVLECGIEIMAQPPGKRLSNVQLLSGGEKAMSAIALLFAVFRYQPSPFCLLDEVDAALDDANVGRFARMVKEYADNTQFIIITHNKLSMESANLLYGVTMEEAGVSKLVSLQLE